MCNVTLKEGVTAENDVSRYGRSAVCANRGSGLSLHVRTRLALIGVEQRVHEWVRAALAISQFQRRAMCCAAE